ncbi:YnhF family membrane protein [Escherichia coli]|nr:YnhF family membrane protein [Escherichia coli]
MSTDLKFSLVTTIIVLGLIVARGFDMPRCTDFLSRERVLPRISFLFVSKMAKVFSLLLFSFFCDCCHAFATLMNIA